MSFITNVLKSNDELVSKIKETQFNYNEDKSSNLNDASITAFAEHMDFVYEQSEDSMWNAGFECKGDDGVDFYKHDEDRAPGMATGTEKGCYKAANLGLGMQIPLLQGSNFVSLQKCFD